jgi:hypothetical protein
VTIAGRNRIEKMRISTQIFHLLQRPHGRVIAPHIRWPLILGRGRDLCLNLWLHARAQTPAAGSRRRAMKKKGAKKPATAPFAEIINTTGG